MRTSEAAEAERPEEDGSRSRKGWPSVSSGIHLDLEWPEDESTGQVTAATQGGQRGRLRAEPCPQHQIVRPVFPVTASIKN